MNDRGRDRRTDAEPPGVNPGYAAAQLARAFVTRREHQDAATRKRAEERISRWEAVLAGILAGNVRHGSRTPVGDVPAWATLEVVTGGFATGKLMAGGALRDHERELLVVFPDAPPDAPRFALNAYFLTEAGFADLLNRLQTGCYDVELPEEGALLVATWLAHHGHTEAARSLIAEIAPFFPHLRFYPIPTERICGASARVHLQDAGTTLKALRHIRPNERILAQKEAVEVWAPFHDRVIALFLETVDRSWPCQSYPDGWSTRALALLGEFAVLRAKHRLCGKVDRPNRHQAQLRAFLGKAATDPSALTGREIGMIRVILDRSVRKRGIPGSHASLEARRQQVAHVAAPLHSAIAGVVASRLERYPSDVGLDDVAPLVEPVGAEEVAHGGVPEGTMIPPSICRKVERCLNETVENLVERGLITSGETLARLLPQVTSGIRAAGIADPTLRRLDAMIYQAFRRRRSLLLLNLEKQVQIAELPWVAAIEGFRTDNISKRDLARQAFEEIATLALVAFPHAILPNKLLQELRALVKEAGLEIPLVDELAADIFMGQLTPKFAASSVCAAGLLEGTLYATYYGIDWNEVRQAASGRGVLKKPWFRRSQPDDSQAFVRLCAARAGVPLGSWRPTTNGMILEQLQILTTQNLAAIFAELGLADSLRDRLVDMANDCFVWICRCLKNRVDGRHARLIAIKNAAYAWRQMVFYLALRPRSEVAAFLGRAEAHLEQQPTALADRLRPALRGLSLAADGRSPTTSGAHIFLGWSQGNHWLIDEPSGG